MESLLTHASSYAADIDFVIWVIAVFGAFWLLLSEGVFFYFCFKYRRSRNPKAEYITGEKKEEMKFIHWPHNVIILCDLVVIFFAVRVWYNVKQDLPPAQETVQIIGQQWAWTFVHPGLNGQLGDEDDVRTVNELRVKVDTTYHYKLESTDVLHDFSVPVFRLKQDAVPGRVITGWFKPTKTGTFDIQCAEMCGIGHGIMNATLVVESSEDHQRWLQSQTAGG